MERQWMTLDQIKVEYASNDYNPELLLQHLLHHVEASPASVPEGVVEWMQNIDSAMKEPIFQEARALIGTENYGQDVSLLQALRLVRRRMLAAANALENIASTSSSTRIRRVANDALTAIRARRNHG